MNTTLLVVEADSVTTRVLALVAGVGRYNTTVKRDQRIPAIRSLLVAGVPN